MLKYNPLQQYKMVNQIQNGGHSRFSSDSQRSISNHTLLKNMCKMRNEIKQNYTDQLYDVKQPLRLFESNLVSDTGLKSELVGELHLNIL